MLDELDRHDLGGILLRFAQLAENLLLVFNYRLDVSGQVDFKFLLLEHCRFLRWQVRDHHSEITTVQILRGLLLDFVFAAALYLQ